MANVKKIDGQWVKVYDVKICLTEKGEYLIKGADIQTCDAIVAFMKARRNETIADCATWSADKWATWLEFNRA